MIKQKKAEMSQEAVVVTIMVAAVIVIGIGFLVGVRLDLIIGNLPSFQGPGDKDREIEGIDFETEFDCKYPIGYIGSDKKIYLVDDLNFNEDSKVSETELTYTRNNEVKFGTRTIIASLEERIISGRLQNIRDIKLNQEASLFLKNPSVINIGTPVISENYREDLRKNMEILEGSKVYMGARGLGLICAKESTIERLERQEDCIERCAYFGGECLTNGNSGEISIGKLDCDNSMECYIIPGNNLNDEKPKFSRISLGNDLPLVFINESGVLRPITKEEFQFSPRTTPRLTINTNKEENTCVSSKVRDRSILNRSLGEDEIEVVTDLSLYEADSILAISLYNPSDRTFSYINIKLSPKDEKGIYTQDVNNLHLIVHNMKVGETITFNMSEYSPNNYIFTSEYNPPNYPIFEIERGTTRSVRIYTFLEDRRGIKRERINCRVSANSNLGRFERYLVLGALSLGAVEDNLHDTLKRCMGIN